MLSIIFIFAQEKEEVIPMHPEEKYEYEYEKHIVNIVDEYNYMENVELSARISDEKLDKFLSNREDALYKFAD